MKRFIALILLAALFTCGCAATKKDETVPASVELTPAASDIDFDLTTMGATMVYSYVYNLLNEPLEYIGKRFKLKGSYEEFVWEENGETYHNIIIADATACCSEGLEFIMRDGNAKYPASGSEIVVVGTLESYYEGEDMYLHVVCDEMKLA